MPDAPWHDQTEHTWQSVRTGGGMDWRRQPEVFKHYPEAWPAIALKAYPQLERMLQLSAGVTAGRTYGDLHWHLRANPSAGALYPCEVYVQARSYQGMADGLYHFEPLANRLRLLRRLGRDGLEAYCPDRAGIEGLTFLVSALYYRSSWKYRDRAIRYCLLDAGHILGGMEAAAQICGLPVWFRTQFDRPRLEEDLGFSGRELAVAMAVCDGTRMEGEIERLTPPLPYCDGTGFFQANPFIEQHWPQIARDAAPSPLPAMAAADCYPFAEAVLAEAMISRRSSRTFAGKPIEREMFDGILEIANREAALENDQRLTAHAVVNRVDGLEQGLYRDGVLQTAGDFSGLAGYLCLEQALAAGSGVTLFLTGSADKPYLAQMLKAGLVGHRIYLAAGGFGLGCSGIGAFYDKEVQAFLEIDALILYVLVIGR